MHLTSDCQRNRNLIQYGHRLQKDRVGSTVEQRADLHFERFAQVVSRRRAQWLQQFAVWTQAAEHQPVSGHHLFGDLCSGASNFCLFVCQPMLQEWEAGRHRLLGAWK